MKDIKLKLVIDESVTPVQHSEFTTAFSKCCPCFFLLQQNFAVVIILIPLVKAFVTPKDVFTLFQTLSRRHSRSLTLVMLQASCNGFK